MRNRRPKLRWINILRWMHLSVSSQISQNSQTICGWIFLTLNSWPKTICRHWTKGNLASNWGRLDTIRCLVIRILGLCSVVRRPFREQPYPLLRIHLIRIHYWTHQWMPGIRASVGIWAKLLADMRRLWVSVLATLALQEAYHSMVAPNMADTTTSQVVPGLRQTWTTWIPSRILF